MIRGFRLVVPLFAFAAVFSQPAKSPLTHRDYDAWRTIQTPTLSRDGKFLAYAVMPFDGDGDLVVREIASGKEWRAPVGTLPPPPIIPPEEVNPEDEPPRRTVQIRFTSDSRFVAATTYPLKADTEKARKEKKRPEEMPKGGLVIMNLGSGAVTSIDNVKSMQVPEKGGPWLAYLKEGKPEPRPADSAKPTTQDAGEDQRAAGARAGAASGSARTEYGTDLVLRSLERTEINERTFASVLEYSFARDGKNLLFAVSSRKPEENGVFAIVPGSDAAPQALLAGKGRYAKLVWSREQKQLAFVSSKDDPESKQPKFKVYTWDRSAAAASETVSAATPGFPAKFVVSDKGALGFSRDGTKLYVPTALPPKPEKEPDPPSGADEKVIADLWHWRDDLVQPMQKIRANQERNRTYRGVYHLAAKRYIQLADESLATVTLSDDGNLALGTDDRPYRRMIDYDGAYNDVWLVDSSTGKRRPLIRQLRGGGGPSGSSLQWSPDGHYGAYYNDKQWFLLSLPEGASTSLTGSLKVAFHDEEDDTPDPPGSYGNAGWTKDSKSFLVYDRFDVWQVFVDGSPAKNLTRGQGRKSHIQFRVVRLDPPDEDDAERGIDPAKPLTLRAVSETTRDSGFYRTTFAGTTGPGQLLWGAKNYASAAKAKDADVVLITASRFDEYPDVYVTNSAFSLPRKATDGGAQLAKYNWGTAELIQFRNTDGVPLRATLYKPENFDPGKKYPMIVYIYEKLSQGVHSFINPGPGTSINVPYYVSNGYLILEPDIVYTTGYPGQSALKCVLPAIDAVVQNGYVDQNAIGIQGHSWGGYQIAYMVTQTTRFKAAEAGAPVGNMTSAYSGIRWGSGMPRQFQYEQTQSRIGKPLYAAPERFMENSAVFYAERVKTPLLILHNDNDDAVPWYQGIELFLALRRNNKEAYLFNYNGEYHGLRRRQNQRDWTVRMQQFFDHHLKGAPAPEWMQKGIPFLDREEEKEKFNRPTDR